jgi:hypothetical protein
MRAAPAVQVPSRDGGLWRAAQALLAALAAAGGVSWAAGWAEVPAGSTALLALAAAGVAAGLQALAAPAPPRTIGWDGGGWWLEEAGCAREAGRIRPSLDLGAWMLVRFEPEPGGAGRWLPLARRDAPAAWPAWRAAVAAAPARAAGAAAAP